MKTIALLVLSAVLTAGPAVAQAATPLPNDPGLRAAACTAILGAMSGSVRPSSAEMAAEMDALSLRWRAETIAIYAKAGRPMDGDQAISAATLEMVGANGLPSGTFDKAVTCQNEGQALPK